MEKVVNVRQYLYTHAAIVLIRSMEDAVFMSKITEQINPQYDTEAVVSAFQRNKKSTSTFALRFSGGNDFSTATDTYYSGEYRYKNIPHYTVEELQKLASIQHQPYYVLSTCIIPREGFVSAHRMYDEKFVVQYNNGAKFFLTNSDFDILKKLLLL